MKIQSLPAFDTPVSPGQRVRWLDREAPIENPDLRLQGSVTGLDLTWDGNALVLDGAFLRWDAPYSEGAGSDLAEVIPASDLDQLEVVS